MAKEKFLYLFMQIKISQQEMQNSPKRPNKKADDVHGDFNYLHFDNEEFNYCRTIPARYFFHKNIKF